MRFRSGIVSSPEWQSCYNGAGLSVSVDGVVRFDLNTLVPSLAVLSTIPLRHEPLRVDVAGLSVN